MNTQRKLLMATALAVAVSLTGCWDDDDGDNAEAPVVVVPPPGVITEVPGSAGASIAAFVAYLLSLSGTDETSEPLTIRDTFAVPADETSEPATLT